MSSATQTTSIVFRDLEAIDEIKALEDLQIEAWGDAERDIVPLNQFVAARHVGGSLIGAFDGEKLVGFVYGFYGHIGGRLVHHSHMLAVSPGYRRHNLGFRLKAEQRQRVLAHRLTDRMTWTFDPLQSLNAHFNFTKLGVLSDTYKMNVYGEEGTSFLHRNGTDRLFVTWLLNSPRVQKLMAEKQGPKNELADLRRSASRLRSMALAMAFNSTSSLNGFVRNSRAPAFIACTDIGTSPWPVMKIIGMSVRSASCCCS